MLSFRTRCGIEKRRRRHCRIVRDTFAWQRSCIHVCVRASLCRWLCVDVCVAVRVWWCLRVLWHTNCNARAPSPTLATRNKKQQLDAPNAAPATWSHPAPQSSNAPTSSSHGVMMSWWQCWCDDAWHARCLDVCAKVSCIIAMWCADDWTTDGGEGGGGEGEAGDAAPKIRTPHGEVQSLEKWNRLKYQRVDYKLQPLEATFLQNLCVKLLTAKCPRLIWSWWYSLFLQGKLGARWPMLSCTPSNAQELRSLFGSRIIQSCWMMLNDIKWYYVSAYILKPMKKYWRY